MFDRTNESEPSLRYRNKSNDLWQQYQQGLIDHNRYLELLEQNKADEIENVNKRFGLIGGVSPETRSRIEHEIWTYENYQRQRREQEAQRKAELERIKSLSPLEKYKEDVPETIERYRKESNGYRRIANNLQIIIIVGSVLATSTTSAIGLWDVFKWLAPAFSILVAISAGLTAYFKFKERSFNLQQTADAIEQEFMAAKLGIGYYKGKQPQEALETFAERIEFMKDEQKKRQQQLEQPPDIKHGISHS